MTESELILLPPPPEQREDRYNDLGWISRGPSRRSRREAEEALKPLLLREGEESWLPPDPEAEPLLPPPLEDG